MTIFLTRSPEGAFPSDLGRWHHPDLRVVYTQAHPGDTNPGAAAMTVMESLGKRADVAGGRDGVHENLAWLPLWLRAHQVEWLVLADPHVLRPNVLGTLLRVVSGSPVNLVLATRPTAPSDITAVLDGYSPTHVPWTRISRTLPKPPRTTGPVIEPPVQPPNSDWYRYRTDCRDLLPAEQHQALDRHYLDGLTATQHWLDTATPDETSTSALLAHQVGQAHSLAEGLTRVRAAQAAFFGHGWHLRIHQTRLMQTLAAAADTRFTDADWVSLRAYRPPHRSALVALHQAGIPLDDLMTITVADVAAALDAGQIGPYPIAPAARPFLTAQLLQRVTEHATADDTYITGPVRTPGDVINRAARDLGLLIGKHHASQNRHTQGFWQWRAGFSLARL